MRVTLKSSVALTLLLLIDPIAGQAVGHCNHRTWAPWSKYVAVRRNGSIVSWGGVAGVDGNVPTGTSFIGIVSNTAAFAATRADGTIAVWGDSDYGGTGAPTGSDFARILPCPIPGCKPKIEPKLIASTHCAFAALDGHEQNGGRIHAWGCANKGGSGAPYGHTYTTISATSGAFAALATSGQVKSWGELDPRDVCGAKYTRCIPAPTDSGYVAIYSNERAFTALKGDGSVRVWGYAFYAVNGGGYVQLGPDGYLDYNSFELPTGIYTAIYAAHTAFAGLKADGSIDAWGLYADSRSASYPPDKFRMGGETGGFPTGVTGFTNIVASQKAFAALKVDGSLASWGDCNTGRGCSDMPTDAGYVKIYRNNLAFCAMKADGSLKVWGAIWSGGYPADVLSVGSGWVAVYSTDH